MKALQNLSEQDSREVALTILHHLKPINSSDQYKRGSIMNYGEVCQHDDGFMCECRVKALCKILFGDSVNTDVDSEIEI